MRPSRPTGELDDRLRRSFGLIAGVDEVGRGALAGPVTVAAVILDPARPISGLDDSKRLSPATRRRLAGAIRERAIAWAVVSRSAQDVDRLNVLGATRHAMQEALRLLRPAPRCAVVDAVRLEGLPFAVIAEPRADGRYLCVAAASILAKVERDLAMVSSSASFPGYGWERNKGYGTPEHLAALGRLGASPLHRRSFTPVRVLA